MKTQLPEFEINPTSVDRATVWWADSKARYHVWIYHFPEREPTVSNTIFKNPPTGIGRRDHGYFHTRKLDLNAKSYAAIKEHLCKPEFLAEVKQACIAYAAAEKAKQEQEAAAFRAAKALREAAPDLLSALKKCEHQICVLLNGRSDNESVIVVGIARDAIAKAEGRAET